MALLRITILCSTSDISFVVSGYCRKKYRAWNRKTSKPHISIQGCRRSQLVIHARDQGNCHQTPDNAGYVKAVIGHSRHRRYDSQKMLR